MKLTTEQFIQRARLKHGELFDYSNVKYVLSSEKVIIICYLHGEFSQTANSHLSGRGYQKCFL